MSDGLERMELWAGQMLAQASEGERRKLLRAVSRDLRKSQHQRMAAQKNPDGSGWEPRKRGAQRQQVRKPVRFVYRNSAGEEREISLTSWRPEGDRLIGFDAERRAVRTFRKDRVLRYLSDEAADAAGGGRLRRKAGRKGRLRNKRMMLKLSRKLHARADSASIIVGFAGAMTRIARVHHEGMRDRVLRDREQPSATYPARRLLGFTEVDRERLMDTLLAHFDPEP